MPSKRKLKNKKWQNKIGLICLGISGLIIFLTFSPIIKQELIYFFLRPSLNVTVSLSKKSTGVKKIIRPADEQFSIIIPKINANAKIIENVDPYDEKKYQKSLAQGVAQAAGTKLPTQKGNLFLFAHSAENWYMANRYNAVFYLLYKLEKNDDVYIAYRKQIFRYKIESKKIVDGNDIQYLSNSTEKDQKILTLMTCWPPGTTLKRLIIIAKQI